jgi:hypothetical protein
MGIERNKQKGATFGTRQCKKACVRGRAHTHTLPRVPSSMPTLTPTPFLVSHPSSMPTLTPTPFPASHQACSRSYRRPSSRPIKHAHAQTHALPRVPSSMLTLTPTPFLASHPACSRSYRRPSSRPIKHAHAHTYAPLLLAKRSLFQYSSSSFVYHCGHETILCIKH